MREPRARHEEILIWTAGDDLVAYDQRNRQAHCLDRPTAAVWRHCDGRTSIDELARIVDSESGTPVGVAGVYKSLATLAEAGLLTEAGGEPTRGRVTRKQLLMAAAGLGLAAPSLHSLNTPGTASAAVLESTAAPGSGPSLPVLDTGWESFNVCNPAYGAIGDGVAFDDAAIAACLADANAKCPGGATIVFPPGKTFRVRRSVVPFVSQVLSGYGATIKRMDQAVSNFSGSVMAGSTTTVTGVTDTSAFQVGDMVTIFNGNTYDTQYHAVLNITASSITVKGAFVVSMSGGTIASAFPTIQLNYNYQHCFGLTVDGNLSNFGAFQHWTTLVEIYAWNNSSIGTRIEDCIIQNAPCEGIEFDAIKGKVADNILMNVKGDGIHLGCQDSDIDGNYLFNCDQADSHHAPHGAICFSTINNGTRISNNTIDTCINGIAAADSKGADGANIENNVIRNASNLSIYYLGEPGRTCVAQTYRGNRCYGKAPSRWDSIDSTTVYPAGARAFDISHNYFEGPVLLTQIHDSSFHHNRINLSNDTTSSLLQVKSSQNAEVSSNELIGGGLGILVTHQNNDDAHITVHDNKCIENYAWGIVVYKGVTGPNIRVGDNLCRGTNGSVSPGWVGIAVFAPSDVQVANNTIWSSVTGGASAGIYVLGGGVPGGPTGAIITGNHVRGTMKPILLGSASHNNIVQFNFVVPTSGTATVVNSTADSTVSNNTLIV